MNITKITEQLDSLNFFDIYENLVGYSISTKIVNGIRTDTPCITFHVERKKNILQLAADQIIPPIISLDDIEIVTDVVQSSKIQHLGAPYNTSVSINSSDDITDILRKQNNEVKNIVKLAAGIDISSEIPNVANTNYFNDPTKKTVEPIALNYYKNRPLLGGSSSIHVNSTDATLGLIVRDSTDKSIVAMSNNHVYAGSQHTGVGALSGDYLSTLGLLARQPGTPTYSPYADANYTKDLIGIHKRCVSLDIKGYNKVDCAIVQLTGYSLIQALCTQVIGFKEKGPYTFATTDEINSLIIPSSVNYQSPIFRNGRTLGPLGYPGNLYSKEHTYYANSVPITAVQTNIANIESIKIKMVETDLTDEYYASILKTTNNDYYWRGYSTGNTPYKGTVLSAFELIGNNLDHFGYNALQVWAVSANKIVYYGYPISYLVSDTNIKTNWTQAEIQLPSYEGVKKVILGYFSGFILSGSNLYSIGYNGKYDSSNSFLTHGFGTIGYGKLFDSTTAWTKINGQWKDIYTVNDIGVDATAIIALSADGSVFFTAGSAAYSGIDSPTYYTPYSTDFYNLTTNNLNIGKYEKLFFTAGLLAPGFLNFGLSADGRTLMKFVLVGDTITNDINRKLSAVKLDGVWSKDIDITSTQYSTTYLLTSGSNLYTLGTSAYQPPYNKTQFFAGASKVDDDTRFSLVSGITAEKVSGWATARTTLYGITDGEGVSFLSGGRWCMAGYNKDGLFGATEKGKDDIIVTDIGSIYVGGYNDYNALKFSDCIKFESKNKSFPIIQGGDSGTAVFALLSSTIPSLSTWKCIGLAFAGDAPTNDNHGYIARIDNIINQLKIEPWDGTIPTTPSKINNIVYTSNLQTIQTITLSGRQFFNIGLSSVPAGYTRSTGSTGSTTSSLLTTVESDFMSRTGKGTLTVPAYAATITVSGTTYNLTRIWQLIIMNSSTNAYVRPLNSNISVNTPSTYGAHVISYTNAYNQGSTGSFALTSNDYSIIPTSYNEPINSRIPIQSNYFTQSLSVSSNNSGTWYYKVYADYSTGPTINVVDTDNINNNEKINKFLNEVNNWNTDV